MSENKQPITDDELVAAAASFVSQWAAICRTMARAGVELDQEWIPAEGDISPTWAPSGELVAVFAHEGARYALEPTTLSVTETRRENGWIDERLYSPQGELVHEQRVPVPGSEPWN